MKCPECKHEIPEDSMFCYKCGCNIIEGKDGLKDTCVMDSERKLVTIMFSDMSGYTAMTERLDPEEVKAIMSQIFGKITEIIKKYDGFIERFIGDAVMAVFGVPIAHEDDPIRAIRAALEIHNAVEDFSPQFEEKIGRPLTMHTGINTGLVVTGEVDIEKGTHGLTGDAINLASRMEGLAQSSEILVGESTYQLSKGYFNFETLEPTHVKGKTEPVPVYKVVSALDQQVIASARKGVEAELIGRESEMNMLMEALYKLKQGQGSIISIVGHAGTGKSRLVREFKSRINRKKVQWHEGHAYAYTQNMAYYALTNLLTYAFQVREGDTPEQIKKKVETGVQELLWDRPDAIKYLGGLFSIAYSEIDEVSPEFWREQLHVSSQQLLDALASRNPTVILFEDLHWADVSFIELLRSLIENTRRPILLICVYRPSFHLFQDGEPNNLYWPHKKIELQDMSWEQTLSMLQSMLSSHDLPDELRYFVKQRVEGNPFYLEEVINSLIETGILTSGDGGWELSQSLNLADVPPTIQGVLTARLDRLEKEAKRILQEASVIGRAFFYEVLNRVTELNSQVDECLLGLENLDLIRTRSKEPDIEYIFKHAVTQEVAYNGLLKEDRLEIHERIGRTIERLFSDRMPEFYETLAFHFSKGKSVLKAVDYQTKSGEKSLRRYALDESHQYFHQAFQNIISMEDRSQAENEILIDVIVNWAKVYYYRGDMEGLNTLLSQNTDIAESIDNLELKGMFKGWHGFVLYSMAQMHASYRLLQEAMNIGESINNLTIVGYACTWLGWVCAELGKFEEGINYGQKGHEISISIKTDHYMYFKSLGAKSYNCFYKGHPAECGKDTESLIEYCEKHSQVRGLMVAYCFLGGASALLAGDFPLALQSFGHGKEVSIDPFYKMNANLFLSFGHLLENQMEISLQFAQKVASYSIDNGIRQMGTAAEMIIGICMIDKGQLTAGMRKIEALIKEAEASGRKGPLLTYKLTVGRVYLEIVRGQNPIAFSVLIKNLGFILKHAFSAGKKAETQFNNVISESKIIGAIGIAGQAHLDLATLFQLKKRTVMAREHLEKAITIFKDIGAYAYLKQAEKLAVSIGLSNLSDASE